MIIDINLSTIISSLLSALALAAGSEVAAAMTKAEPNFESVVTVWHRAMPTRASMKRRKR